MRLLYRHATIELSGKMHQQQKVSLGDAVQAIAQNPELGESKVGDLLGVKVYKFMLQRQPCLLAYRVIDLQTIKLLMVGPHENFYRDLKRTDR